MEKWKYFELIAFYYRNFFAALQQNKDINLAIQRSFDDYLFEPKEKYKFLYVIISIQDLEIQISMLNKVSKQSVDFYLKQLEIISTENINEYLLPNEVEHLQESILELNCKLENMGNVF